MSSEVTSPPSPRCDDWTLVDRPVAEAVSDNSDTSPSSEASVEGTTEQELQEQLDGLKSPASERLADDVLREPFQAGLPAQLHLTIPAPDTTTSNTVEEPSTPTGASGPYAASCGDLLACRTLHTHLHRHAEIALAGLAAADAPDSAGHCAPDGCGGGVGGLGGSCGTWGFERNRERLRAACRLSGEGALEGFQDPQDLLLAEAAAPGPAGGVGGGGDSDFDGAGCSHGRGAVAAPVGLGWDGLWTGVWADLMRELEDVQALVAATAAALWERVQDGRMAVEEWAAAVRAAANQAAKTVGRSACPLWALIGVSGVAAVALAALAAQLVVNRRLASQLRQRDRDLARLVVKILNLQDALQSAARPILRHTSLERYTTTTTLIGMV